MDAIVILAHGSVLCGSGEALWAHAERFIDHELAESIAFGYLNYTDPPFIEAVSRCVAEGATRIVVTPYFLAPGKFVRVDVPAAINAAKAKYPGIEFVVGDVIGYDDLLADAILDSAANALSEENWGEDLKRASAHCRADSACPLYGTPACPRQPFLPETEAESTTP